MVTIPPTDFLVDFALDTDFFPCRKSPLSTKPMSVEIQFIFVSLERAFLCTTMACESCDDVEQSSSSVSSSTSSLPITRGILMADFDEVKGLTTCLTLGFDGADAVTTSSVSRSGEVKVSMIRPDRRRRLESRSSSLEIIEPFRFTMVGPD